MSKLAKRRHLHTNCIGISILRLGFGEESWIVWGGQGDCARHCTIIFSHSITSQFITSQSLWAPVAAAISRHLRPLNPRHIFYSWPCTWNESPGTCYSMSPMGLRPHSTVSRHVVETIMRRIMSRLLCMSSWASPHGLVHLTSWSWCLLPWRSSWMPYSLRMHGRW